MFIYVDESGNLSGPKGEQYFVLTALLVKDERTPKKLIRKAKKRGLPKKLRRLPEVKGRESSSRFLRFLLGDLSQEDVGIGILVADVRKIPKHLRGKEGLLYLKLSQLLLEECGAGEYSPLILKFDRKPLTGVTKEGFNTALRERFVITPEPKRFEIYHHDSTEDAGLQVVHHIAWSTYQKYQHNDKQWYDLFSQKIIVEKLFSLPPKKTNPANSLRA